MTIQLTNEFSITRLTVHLASGESESLDVINWYEQDGMLKLFHQHEDIWRIIELWGGGYKLKISNMQTHSTSFVQRHVEKVETNWTNEYVAVADVPAVEETEGRIFRKTVEVPDTDYDPEPDIWEKVEWEAHIRQQS